MLSAVLLPLLLPETRHLHAAPVSENVARSPGIKFQPGPDNTSGSAEAARITRILEGFRSRYSLREIRIVDRKGRIITFADPAGQGVISPVTGLPSPPPRDLDAQPASIQNGALAAVYPLHHDSLCRSCHKTRAHIPVFASLTLPEDKPGLLTGTKWITAILFLLGFLLLSAILLIFSPFVLQSAKCRSFAKRDNSRNVGDDAHEALIKNGQIPVADENTALAEGRSRHSRRFKILSTHRNTAVDGPSPQDASIAARLNKITNNKLNTLQRLAAVHKISLATSSSMELEEAFHNLLDITINTLGAEIGYILQFDQENKSFRIRSFLSCYGMPPKHRVIPFASGNVSTLVYKTGKPLLIRDIDEAPQFERQSVLGYERRSLICVPLIVRDEIIGTMAVVNKIDNSMYGSEDLKFLSTIAAQVGLAIKNAKLREDQQKAYMNIVHALVSILDASDSYTKGHSDRVTFYSVELARKINLPRHRIDVVERAAILHDIGKIGINGHLLNKKKQLSPEEIATLKQHPLIGMKILEPLDFLRDVSICIGQHHERIDGAGYPYGFRGGDLLLESRILAIADAYDAMTSDRPYRRALSRVEAIRELEANAGKQHDLDLVRHFVELFECDCLNIPTVKPGSAPSTFTDIDSASEFFTAFSHRPQMPGREEIPRSRTCSSFRFVL